MDGVLIRDGAMVEGADRFLERLRSTGRPFLILTNNSLFTPREVSEQLASMGLDVIEGQLWTSALATAKFVNSQRPRGSAFVIGKTSMHEALADVGYREDDQHPDYVVLGETRTYSFERITRAIRLVAAGARFIATNPDATGPTPDGPLPATGSVAALISHATGVAPYFVGKPNPLMMRTALNYLGVHSENTVMIGDRMETDMVAGVESGMETILVLSGVTRLDEMDRFPYQPARIAVSVAEIDP